MKRMIIGCTLAVLLACGSAGAIGKESDCSAARDPRRCEAQQVAREACSNLQGQARSSCMREAMPPPDCSRAPNTVQCQSKLAAAQACKNKHGKAHRKCLRDSSKSP